MFKRTFWVFIIILAVVLWVANTPGFSRVTREGGKTYIVDATGERWDVTQAESIGFQPEGFQYGLGRNAFTPLDDSFLSDDITHVPQSLRVLGVAEVSEAKAYSIARLRGHEIANSTMGSNPIAAAYWPLIGLAAVYSRQIDDQALTLVPSGWTYNSTFVLYDRETGSLWYPYDKGLMSIQGKYFKRWLPEIPSEDTRWGKWIKKYPNSQILE